MQCCGRVMCVTRLLHVSRYVYGQFTAHMMYASLHYVVHLAVCAAEFTIQYICICGL